MRVLVIGGLGDVGASLLRELAAAGHAVRCLEVRNAATLLTALRIRGQGIQVVWGDVRRPADLVRAVADQDAVVHLAAIIPPRSEAYPDWARAVNVDGTRNLLQALHAQGTVSGRPVRLLYVSSLAVFGRTDDRAPP